jgi:hypothetical protein
MQYKSGKLGHQSAGGGHLLPVSVFVLGPFLPLPTAVTIKNAVFRDIKTQFVPHRKQYVSATEPSPLMLCKIWGFHGGDYEGMPSSEMLCHVALVRTDVSFKTEPYALQPITVCCPELEASSLKL